MPLKTFDEYVALAEQAHGHICAGQILGLRMALYGLKLLELDDPLGKHRKRLVTFIEIDRCATDAIPVVTGCRLGKRALKFRDFGKVAATFCDVQADRAVRVVALADSKQRTRRIARCAWWRSKTPNSAPAKCFRRSRIKTRSRCAPTARCRMPRCSR